MAAREVLNLTEWLKSQNFTCDEIFDCIESVEGKKGKKEDQVKRAELATALFIS